MIFDERMNLNQESIELHKQHGGKLEVRSKVPVGNRHELSLAYTPGVGQVCLEIAKDKTLAKTLTLKKNTVAVVSDGSAVLGLGNLGPEGAIPVMEGKAVLFKEFGSVDAFPICLNTQDTESIIKAVKNIAPVFGGINLEDISAPRCFEIENKLRAELDIPVMHDDQHGTAVVVLAGLINALKLKGMPATEARIVINGAGAAGLAVTELLLEYGVKHIIICDTKGAIFAGRENLTAAKEMLAQKTNLEKVTGDLARVLPGADIFIGLSKPGVLTKEMIHSMNKKPVVFALANPVPEIMPADALAAGAYLVATGRSDYPNQINNVLAFPGLFRGALDNGIKQFTNAMFLNAARALAEAAGEISPEKFLPEIFDKSICNKVAAVVRE